jgi:putative DNA primase/helicase
VITGNHRPSLRTVDEAIRARFHLIPFAVTIPAEERDKSLADKLRAEWPGILAWMIEGTRQWQTDGLQPPQAVREATEVYPAAEDDVTTWIEEKCQRDPGAWEASSALFASFSGWAGSTGAFAGSQKGFKQALEERGFEPARSRIGGAGNPVGGFKGLRLVQTTAEW